MGEDIVSSTSGDSARLNTHPRLHQQPRIIIVLYIEPLPVVMTAFCYKMTLTEVFHHKEEEQGHGQRLFYTTLCWNVLMLQLM